MGNHASKAEQLLDRQPFTGTQIGFMYEVKACKHLILTLKWPGWSSFDILEKASLIKHIFKILTLRK